jgi:hypothetical protein
MHYCDPGMIAYGYDRLGLPMSAGLWMWPGGNWPDLSGQRNDLTISGATVEAGVLVFDGSATEYAEALNVDYSAQNDSTISLWFKPRITYDSSQGSNDCLFTYYKNTINRLVFHLVSTGGSFRSYKKIGGTAKSINSNSTSWMGGQWYHVVVTIGSGGMKMYVDGVLQTDTDSDTDGFDEIGYSNNVLHIGNEWYNGNNYTTFDGAIDNVQIFPCALLPSQIQTLHNNPYGMFEPIRRPPIWSVPSGATYTLTADAGTFTLSGTDADVLLNRLLDADAGTFSLSGQDVNLLFNHLLTTDSGSFALTGQNVDLLFNRLLSAEPGSFSLSGVDVNLLLGRVLGADAGSFILTGTDVDLIYSGGATYTLTAEPGSFSLSGTNASLLLYRLLSADAGSFSLVGQDASLLLNRLLSAESGSFVLTGQDVNLIMNRLLSAETGSFSLAGQDAGLFLNRLLNAEAGSFTLIGQDITLLANRTLGAEAGSFSLVGQDVTLTWSGDTLAVGKLTITFTPRKPGHTFTPRKPGITLS